MKKVIAICFVLLLVITGCGQKNELVHDAVIEKEKEYKREINGVVLRADINQLSSQTGDEIHINAFIKNINEKEITYLTDCGWEHPKIEMKDGQNERVSAREVNPSNIACPDVVREPSEKKLKAHKTLENQKTYSLLGNGNLPLQTGDYKIVVSFNTLNEKLKIEIPIQIKTENLKINQGEEAIKIARTNQKVKEWLKKRSGEFITKVNKGKYYILMYDGWMEAKENEYKMAKEFKHQVQMENAYYSNKQWNVTFSSKLGDSPHRIEILIDAKTKEIKNVITYDR